MRSETTPAGVRQLPAIWDATRGRIAALVGDLSEAAGDTAVTTVSGVTVLDVMAHLRETADKASDITSHHGPILLPMAAAAHRSSMAKMLAGWEEAAAVVRGRIEVDPDLAARLVTDAVMCEHDLRATFGVAGARDDVAIKVALDELSGRFSDRVEAASLPALRVTVEQWGTIAGAGCAIACVVADRFEFVRAMSGRRSAAEVRRWNWGVEPDQYLPVLSEVGLAPADVRERDPRIPEHMRDREFLL